MARKIVGTVFQTLDGVMQAPGGPSEDPTDGFEFGGWQFGFPDEQASEAIGDSLKPPYALLLGRRTYDIFASYWPYQESDDENSQIARDFNAAEKFVMTHSDEPLEWANSRRVAGFGELAELCGKLSPLALEAILAGKMFFLALSTSRIDRFAFPAVSTA